MEMIPVVQKSLVKAFAALCPACGLFLAVGVNELRAGNGKARCGKCSTVFDVLTPGFTAIGRKRELVCVCPGCRTAGNAASAMRAITAENLLAGGGKVQCTDCSTVFDACATLQEAGGSSNAESEDKPVAIWKESTPYPVCPRCGYTHDPGRYCVSGSISAGRNADGPTSTTTNVTIDLGPTPGSISGSQPAREPDARRGPPPSGRFELAGRPALERFFLEHVIDIIENPEQYRAFGVEFPSAIALYGPPGCGKTYAVDKLIEYLGWPSYRMDASSIGSPFIHETSMKVAALFDEAIKNAPSVIVIDEMDAFLSKRQSAVGYGPSHVEEVSEFLRRIPEAAKKKVLVVGMTNQIELIDPAILRRGRFDHVIEVPMATEIEIAALLKKLFTGLPVETGVKIGPIARKLCGRPLSDVSFVVKEAARLAALHRRNKVSDEMVTLALQRTVGE
jgi:predicted Zn finger-like uncharacterized protein